MTDQRKITTDPYALQDPSASSLSQRSTSPAVDDQSKRELRPSHVGRWITQFAQGEPSAQDIDIDPRTEAPKQEIPLEHLLKNNVKWAKRMTTIDPEFFTRLAQQQRPQILWIGCSDSRVPANQIIDLAPGEIFVHRNLANVIYHCDFNSHSVIQYAVDVLKVQHVIVCGHYGCGAIAASAVSKQMGIIDNWVRNIRDVYSKHFDQLQQCKASNPNGPDSPEAHQAMLDLLCELNVANSVSNICATTIIQNAWDRGQKLSVHGWCYRLTDGLIRDLNICFSGLNDLKSPIFSMIETKVTPEA